MGKLLAVGAILCLLLLWSIPAYSQETATLTVRSRYGSPSPPVGNHTYDLNTEITASVATPVAGSPGIRYVCTGWRARGSPETLPPTGETNSVTFTITMNTILTWTWKTQYLLSTTVSPEGSGTVGVAPTSTDGYYDAKSTVTLTAYDNTGYDFGYWSGGLRGTTNPQSMLLRGPRNVVATFIPEYRYLTVASAQGTPSPAVGVHQYYYNDSVSANCGTTPVAGGTGIQYACTGHSGTGNVTGGPETSISFTITSDSSVTWLWQTQYRLTTAVNPPGYGTVTPSGETWHNAGAVVSLTATGIPPYGFINWSGDLSGTENPKDITMNSAKSVVANFGAPTLVVSNPQGYDTPVPPVGTYTYDSGTEVTCSVTSPLPASAPEMTAMTYGTLSQYTSDANMGFRFTVKTDMWVTKVSTMRGNGTVAVTIWREDSAYGATYTLLRTINIPDCVAGVWTEADVNPPLQLTVLPTNQSYRIATYWNGTNTYYYQERLQTSWAGDISVTEGCESYPATPDWPNSYHHYYVNGVCNFKYVKSRYLASYTGTGSCPSGTGNSVTFNIDQASTITWNWALQHHLNITTTPAATGTVDLSPTSADNFYNDGTVVTLTAVPTAAYILDAWSEALTGTTNPQALTMDAPKRVTATFARPRLVVSNPGGYDTPSPAAGTYTYDRGTSVTCLMTTSPVYPLWSTTFTEGFEAGNLTGWTTGYSGGTARYWTAATAAARTGSYGATAGIPSVSGALCYIEKSFTLANGGRVSWYWRFSRGNSSNYMRMRIDGTLMSESNTTSTSWVNVANIAIAAGTHTLRWELYRGSSTAPVYMYLDDVTVQEPDLNTRYTCTGWTGTGSVPASGSGLTTTFTIDAHSTITWNWIGNFKLTVTASPGAGGTIDVSPLQTWYDAGTSVTLTAIPTADWAFQNWTGDLTGTTNPATITMNSTKNITANFKHTVVVTSAYGAPSPPVGATYYADGASVTVNCGTTPYPGGTGIQYVCTGWTGGTGNIPATGVATSYGPFNITLNSTITWAWKTQYLLTTSVTPTFPASGGTIARAPDASWYDAGTVVTLTGNPASGFAFGNWSGDMTGTSNPNALTMDSPKNVVGNFTILTPRNVTVASAYGEPTPPAGVTPCPDGYSVPLSCGPTPYAGPAGTQYVNTGWSGGTGDIPATGTETSYTIPAITQNSTITWTWQVQHQLTWTVNPAGTGSITPASGTWHNDGTVISCTATPNANWGWQNWSGDLSGTENPKDLTMNAPKSITANFFQPILTVSNPAGYDSPNPAVGTYIRSYGSSQTCSVTSPAIPLTTGTFTDGFESGLSTTWSFGGGKWGRGYGTWKRSGSYSALLGALDHDHHSYMERAFTIASGGGQVTFWLKVSSQSGGDYLRFYIDGVEQDATSGEVDWTSRSYSLAEGTRVIKWAYTKNASISSGSDIGCIDDLEITNTTSGTYTDGFESATLPGWTFYGTGPSWVLTEAQKYAGTYSLKSPAIGDGPQLYAYAGTYVQRQFNIAQGGGQVSFWWNVDSEKSYDYLEFYIDDVRQDRICSSTNGTPLGWTQRAYLLSAGLRTLKWRYVKDVGTVYGSDCGWVDDIQVTNNGYPGTNYFCTGYVGTGSCPSGSDASVTFTILQHSSITWNWKTMYLLTLTVDPVGTGTVDISPTSPNGYYDVDTAVTLTATPGSGYLFGQWTGDLTGNVNPTSVTMNGPKTIVANFTGQNKPSNLAGSGTSTSSITWSWTSNNNDWQSIAAGVLRTMASTIDSFWATWGDVPPSETCPRTGTGDDRLFFEAADDLPGLGGDQNCPTINALYATTYTLTYTRVSSSTWNCTADTYLANLYDYYVDQSGNLRRAMSTGDGCQATAGSPLAPDDTWFDIQDASTHLSMGTVYPNLTSWLETGLSENTQYTRHVHAVNGGAVSDPTNDASRYTLIHDATTSEFSLSIGSSTRNQDVVYGSVADRHPIDINYNYARSQILLYGSQTGTYISQDEIGQAGTTGKIVRIGFQRSSGDADEVNVSEIYMTNTALNMLPTTWTDTTSHTLVYTGDLVIPYGDAGTWYEIELTNPFVTNGVQNLLISFRHQDGTGETTYTQWTTVNCSRSFNINPPRAGGRCIRFYDNDQNPPTVPTDQNNTRFPSVRLVFETANVTVTVTPPANSTSGFTGVRIERAPDNTFTTGLTVVRGYAPIYTHIDTPPSPGDWYYRIRFQNGDSVPSSYSDGRMATIPPY